MQFYFYKTPISEKKTDAMVKKALIKDGYSKDIELKRFILDDGIINYQVLNPITYSGNDTFVLRDMNCLEYMGYLRKGFMLAGNDVDEIFPMINEEEQTVTYYVSSRKKEESSNFYTTTGEKKANRWVK